MYRIAKVIVDRTCGENEGNIMLKETATHKPRRKEVPYTTKMVALNHGRPHASQNAASAAASDNDDKNSYNRDTEFTVSKCITLCNLNINAGKEVLWNMQEVF
jgi:hypothetical protein